MQFSLFFLKADKLLKNKLLETSTGLNVIK